MAILQECPICHKRHKVTKNKCSCGENLEKARRAQRVKYYISFRLPNGTQRRELVGNSIAEAYDADGKRRVQKRENRIFDILPDAKITFEKLTAWYLNLEKTKNLAGLKAVKVYLDKFNREFGSTIVADIKTTDLENLQEKRKKEDLKPKTIDHEIETMKRVIWKAFRDDKVSGYVLKAFQNVKKLCKAHSNRRERVLTPAEFRKLHDSAEKHLQGILSMGYWTGMRKGEIIGLTWDKVNLKERTITLKPEDTKDREARVIPIGDELFKSLSKIVRALHDDHVFLYNGKPILQRFETAMKSACEGAGLTWGREVEGGLIFHDLRHTFVTDMRKAGVERTVTMAVTGHAIRDMNERYDTVDTGDKQAAIKKLEGIRANVDQTLTKTSFESPN